jgi:hypothetical protein
MMGEGAFKRKKEPDVVVHACNPSTREAEFKASLSTIVKRCLKEREREREKKKEEEKKEEEEIAACNPTYSDQEFCGSKPAQANSSPDPISKTRNTKQDWWSDLSSRVPA